MHSSFEAFDPSPTDRYLLSRAGAFRCHFPNQALLRALGVIGLCYSALQRLLVRSHFQEEEFTIFRNYGSVLIGFRRIL